MHRHSILLLEDEEELASLLEEILEGCDVRWANSMKQARDLSEGFKPCAIVSDLTLPDVGRTEVVPSLRELQPDVPILLISAIPPAELRTFAEEQGADGAIAKPFDIDAFEDAVLYGCEQGSGV